MKRCVNGKSVKRKSFPLNKIVLAATVSVVGLVNTCYSQDAVQGIKDATTAVKSYYAVGIYLMYGIGGLAGIVGAVKTFNQWNSGDPHTTKTASAWFGSCLFLVVVATILKTVFGL